MKHILNRETAIGLNLLQYLYYAKGAVTSGEELASSLDESLAFCQQILLTLKRKGYVHTVRGAKGGYVLAHDAPLRTLSIFLQDTGRSFGLATGYDVELASERVSREFEALADASTLVSLFTPYTDSDTINASHS